MAAAIEIAIAARERRQEYRHHHPLLRGALPLDRPLRRIVSKRASWPDVTPAQAARSCGHNDTVTGKSTAGRETLTATSTATWQSVRWLRLHGRLSLCFA